MTLDFLSHEMELILTNTVSKVKQAKSECKPLLHADPETGLLGKQTVTTQIDISLVRKKRRRCIWYGA